MSDLMVQIPAQLADFVQNQVHNGEFSSPQEYVCQLLQREQARMVAGQKLLDEAIAEMERGEGLVWTREEGQRLLQESLRKARGVSQ